MKSLKYIFSIFFLYFLLVKSPFSSIFPSLFPTAKASGVSTSMDRCLRHVRRGVRWIFFRLTKEQNHWHWHRWKIIIYITHRIHRLGNLTRPTMVYDRYHLVMTNIANWKITIYKWRFLAGKIIYKWTIFHGHVK